MSRNAAEDEQEAQAHTADAKRQSIRGQKGGQKRRRSRARREGSCGGHGCLNGPRQAQFRDAKLITRMRPQGVMGHELVGNLDRESRAEPTADIDPCELLPFGVWGRGEFLSLSDKVRTLGIGLGADRDILAGRHRESARDETRKRGE